MHYKCPIQNFKVIHMYMHMFKSCPKSCNSNIHLINFDNQGLTMTHHSVKIVELSGKSQHLWKCCTHDNFILHSKILISLAFRQHSLGLKILSKKMMFSHDICIKIDLKKMSMYIELNVDNKITIAYISHYYL